MRTDTYQKKFIISFAGLILILALSWNLAFRKTWNCYSELKEVNNEMNNIDISEKTVTELEKQLAEIRLTHVAIQDTLKSELVFKKISDLSVMDENVRIVQFPEVHQCSLNDYRIETTKLELEGNFINLLQFIYDLENEPSIGGISSIHFRLEKDYKQDKEFLKLDILVQNLKKNATIHEKNTSIP